MKNMNVKVHEITLENLKLIQAYYSEKFGVSFNQSETLAKLLQETANLIRNTGETYPGRDWTFEIKENQTYKDYNQKKEEKKDK